MTQPSSGNMKSVVTQINVLNSKMQLIIQQLKKLESNFGVISRTVISQNNLVKELEAKIDSLESGTSSSATPFSRGLESEKVIQEIENIKEELKEMKYVLDSVNPIAYVTIDEVSDVVDQKLKEIKKKKK